MTLYHFANCLGLAYTPYYLTYKYSGLAEYGAFWKVLSKQYVHFSPVLTFRLSGWSGKPDVHSDPVGQDALPRHFLPHVRAGGGGGGAQVRLLQRFPPGMTSGSLAIYLTTFSCRPLSTWPTLWGSTLSCPECLARALSKFSLLVWDGLLLNWSLQGW